MTMGETENIVESENAPSPSVSQSAPEEQQHETNTGPAEYEPACSPKDSPTDKRPVVAVDLDEVLGHFVPQLCEFHNTTYNTSLTPEDFECYQFHEVWGGTRDEADQKMRKFFESPYFLGNGGIPPVEGAADVLRKHTDKLDLHIVTSRQNILEEHTRQWVSSKYPDIFTELHFGNHHSLQGDVRSKPDLCKSIDAVMIIDDNMHYATQCAEAGIRACLFGDYAWNRTPEELPSHIRRTVSWEHVDTALRTLSEDADSEDNGYDGPPIIAIEASKNAAHFVDVATAKLAEHGTVCLRSLEKAVMVGVDTAQELERLGIAKKSSLQTSLVDLPSGNRTCVEVTLVSTPEFEARLNKAGDKGTEKMVDVVAVTTPSVPPESNKTAA